MTALAATLKSGGLLSPLPSSSGVSTEARTLRDRVSDTRRHLCESLALRTLAEVALAELDEARGEAQSENWDGYAGRPLDPRAYAQAGRFLTALPTTTPIPAISSDPDGEVEVSWNRAPRWVFSVSIGPTGRLTYAGLFGNSRAYGTEWLGAEIPRPVLENVARLFASR